MKIRINMISGSIYEIEDPYNNNIEDWIRNNFGENVNWIKIKRFVININKIEAIEEVRG